VSRFPNPILRRALLAFVIALSALTLTGAGDSPDARFSKMGHGLMCMCGCGQVLIECNHVGCSYSERMLGELKDGIARGDSDSLILQGFTQKYGNTVLSAPTTTGFNRIAWIMPFVVLTLGTIAVVTVVRTWNRRTVHTPVPPPAKNEGLDEFRERARRDTEL
jgi:cytochrome c-type biogenesis protein CcmH/NrfF